MLGQFAKTLLRARYVVIGSLVGGGYTLSQTVQSWKDKLPDVGWLHDYLPDGENIHLMIDSAKHLPSMIQEKGREVRHRWLQDGGYVDQVRDTFRDNIYAHFQSGYNSLREIMHVNQVGGILPVLPDTGHPLDDSLQIQMKFQREVERLEKENAELRQILILNSEKSERRQTKLSLIDMYSEVLDLLTEYDSSYSMHDHLPRVVVVGDQSSGKTSVLEMIAQARIFPRGSGEIMTRAPVKVTLSEGPYHIAHFRDSQREFDLTAENELADLRHEIELRMRNSVANGKTVSKDVIALTVKGPNLPRMVLVDLPGVISTVTTDMASETKNDIIEICKCHMENPNAIILCIQDGSVDAERSNVTELVSSLDPHGKRTLVVLTKVDMAEENLMNPDRVKKILDGKLFPMKALGYFAVVTGRGNRNDSIEEIRNYEESFFANSTLFRSSGLKPSQMTTRNMSKAVSERFWKMVQESIEQQADSFHALQFNLEAEWRNSFPRKRQLDRDELFQLAKYEVLNEVLRVNSVSAKDWEQLLHKALWNSMSKFIFDNILLPAAVETNRHTFETKADIRLKHWVDKVLPVNCADIAWQTLKQRLIDEIKQDGSKSSDEEILTPLKHAIIEEAICSHRWDPKAVDYLKVIQTNVLEDRVVPDANAWSEAANFYKSALHLQLLRIQEKVDYMVGPGWFAHYFKWKKIDDSHVRRKVIVEELKPLLKSRQGSIRSPVLGYNEIEVVQRHMAEQRSDISIEEIRDVWHWLYQKHFLQRSVAVANECANLFLHYQSEFLDVCRQVDCSPVVLFWRLQRMMNATVVALRQQIMNAEFKRLEAAIKKVLLDWSHCASVKKQFLVGRQVELVEELRQVRQIQEKLEEFITALKASESGKP